MSKRWVFEEGVKRPYFHVKPLEKAQLKNWKEYLGSEIPLVLLYFGLLDLFGSLELGDSLGRGGVFKSPKQICLDICWPNREKVVNDRAPN